MLDMWSSLVPLILGCALEPIKLVITIMLLGTPSHLRAAGAWVGGHVTTRLLHGLIFGSILHWGARSADRAHAHYWIVSTVLLVTALLFLVTAARELLSGDDPNAPPPTRMAGRRESAHHRHRSLLPATVAIHSGPRAALATGNNRPVVIVVGLAFGIWFGIKALRGFGIL